MATNYAAAFEMKAKHLRKFFKHDMFQPGGRVEFVTGNIVDPGICPGPFDVIIARRIIQHYELNEGDALAALVKRLSANGIIVIHHHNAGDYRCIEWLSNNGFELSYGWHPKGLFGPGRNPDLFLRASPGKRAAWTIASSG